MSELRVGRGASLLVLVQGLPYKGDVRPRLSVFHDVPNATEIEPKSPAGYVLAPPYRGALKLTFVSS